MRILNFLSAAVVLVAAASANANLIISEVVDGTLSGGTPKYIELTNTGAAPIDLSNFSLGNANNGATTIGFDALVLSGTLAGGDSYVVSYENGDAPGASIFFDVYGFDADNLDQGSFFNGDDTLILYSGAATAGTGLAGAVDVYGVLGTDGTGQSWEYTDSYVFRNPNVLSGNPTFTESEWFIAGVNALETGDDAEETVLLQTLTTPGTHTIIPEPAAGLLALVGGAFVARRR